MPGLQSAVAVSPRALSLGVAYDRAAASLHGSGATAFTISVNAHCPAWNDLRPAADMAIGNNHGLRVP